MMWRVAPALVLLAHGPGHSLFLVQAWGLWPVGATSPGRSWLIGLPLMTDLFTERIASLLWLAPLAGFAVATRMLLTRDWRARPWLLGAAVASATLVALAWGGIAPIGALLVLAVDGAVIEGAWMRGAPSVVSSRLSLPVPLVPRAGRRVSPMRRDAPGSTVGTGCTGLGGRVDGGRPMFEGERG